MQTKYRVGDWVTVYFNGQEEVTGRLMEIYDNGVSVKPDEFSSWHTFRGSDVVLLQESEQTRLF